VATETIELTATDGLTLTADVYPIGSDTAAFSAVALTERTNCKGTYRGDVAGPTVGWYSVVVKESTAVVAKWRVYLTNTTRTAYAGDYPDEVISGQSIGSVAGAVGSVTGAVGSVTGAVGSVTGAVGSVTGAVGSVTAGVTVTTNNDKTGYALSAAGVQAIWDALSAALTTVGSIGKRLVDYLTGDSYARLGAPVGASTSADIAAVQASIDNTVNAKLDVIEAQTDDIGTAGAGLSAIPWNAAWDAEVQSEVQDAIEANNLDHLVGTATGIPSVPAGTFLDQVMDDGTAAFDRTTDSLQAIRDRGDAAWVTGGASSGCDFLGTVAKSGSTYFISFVAVQAGAIVASGSLSSLVCAFYDEDGTDLTFSGTLAAGANNVIYASGTLGTAITDNRPVMVKVGATIGGTAYSGSLTGVNVA